MTTIAGATELERLVARSRLIGADPALVVHGGGNTSTKRLERDHRGRERRVLRVKGSGTDLASIGADGFPGLFLDELLPLRERDAMTDEEMVAYLAHCMVEPGSRTPSIETLLHGFLPAAHVDHVHADAICALTNHPGGRAAVEQALGADVAYVPYVRPGFELSRQVAELADARAVVLEHHGLVTWGETHEESYDLTVELVRRARDAVGPVQTPAPVTDLADADVRATMIALRAALTTGGTACVLHVDRSQRRLADRPDVDRVAAGRGTPDHILRIGIGGVVVRNPAEARGAVERFADHYRAYFARHAASLAGGARSLSPLPRVALVPGLGCIAVGPTAKAARMHAEIAHRSHLVTAMALDAFGTVEWLDESEVFAFDYWPMELRKLRLAPAPPPLTGRAVVASGAADGLGDALRARLGADGASVFESVDAAVIGAGGVDAVVNVGDAGEAAVRAAERVWERAGATGVVVYVAASRSTAELGDERSITVAVDQGASAERVAETVAFVVSGSGEGLAGSRLRAHARG